MVKPVGVFAFLFFLVVQLQAASQKGSVGTELDTLLIPADRLATIKSALPNVASSSLKAIFNSPQTLWYDSTVMTQSYQDSVGANANAHWPDLVAASEDVIDGLHNRTLHRWQFPFGATAGTDNSTNLQVENFVSFPQPSGQMQPVMITEVPRNDNRMEWTWTYPAGTVFGEILFIQDGSNILPVEVRTRTRQASGWSTDVFRPFLRASDLANAIKQQRPDWASMSNLVAMINFLSDNTTLKPASLTAVAGLASTFSQDGYLDTLPDFGDDALVRTLLTTTTFHSAHETVWKQNGNQVTYAASTSSSMSIVPLNYTAGIIEVNDSSCMRCHQDTGRLVSDFYFDVYLYGELWGKDGIFTFHPYDESLYPQLRVEGFDNRALNPKLRQAGVFQTSFSARPKTFASTLK